MTSFLFNGLCLHTNPSSDLQPSIEKPWVGCQISHDGPFPLFSKLEKFSGILQGVLNSKILSLKTAQTLQGKIIHLAGQNFRNLQLRILLSFLKVAILLMENSFPPKSTFTYFS